MAYRGNLTEQAELIDRYREHAAAESRPPQAGSPELRDFDWRAYDTAVARWEGALQYFAKALADQLELHVEAES